MIIDSINAINFLPDPIRVQRVCKCHMTLGMQLAESAIASLRSFKTSEGTIIPVLGCGELARVTCRHPKSSPSAIG